MKWQNQLEIYRGHCQSTWTTEEIHILKYYSDNSTRSSRAEGTRHVQPWSHGRQGGNTPGCVPRISRVGINAC